MKRSLDIAPELQDMVTDQATKGHGRAKCVPILGLRYKTDCTILLDTRKGECVIMLPDMAEHRRLGTLSPHPAFPGP